MLDRILVALDDSRESWRALRLAIELCRRSGADLKAIAVQKPVPSCFLFAVAAFCAEKWRRAQQEKCKTLQLRAREQMARAGIYPDAELLSGEEVGSIVRFAKQYRADLVVIGRCQTFFINHRFGDVAERAPCAVLGVP